MDDNTRDVLTTLIQVGGGLIAGLLAAWFAFRWVEASSVSDGRERTRFDDRSDGWIVDARCASRWPAEPWRSDRWPRCTGPANT